MGNINAMQKLIDLANRIKNESLETSNTILDLVKRNYSPKIESVIKEYDLDRNEKFNIFETISDLYKREKFHSDILYSILAKETPEIGSIHNYEILTEFIKMIDETLDFVIDDTIEISKEEYNVVWDGNADKEGYVDILIKNGHNQAIIIENKINDAPDQPNQLVRYMSYIKEQVFKNNNSAKIIVLYLTLVPGKIPQIDEYDEYFAKYKEILKDAKNGKDGKILKYRSAVDNDEKKGNLVKFLESCLEYFDQDFDSKSLVKRIYLEQYKILLSHLGGNVAMLEYQKDLVKNIYSSKENLKAAKDLVEVFSVDKNGDNMIVNKYINDCLKPFVEPLGFNFEDNWLYRIWDKNHVNYLYVLGQFCKFQIGFGTSKELSKSKQNEFQKILEDAYKLKTETPDRSWVWLQIEPLADKKNMEDFINFCTSFIPKIKEEFLSEKA